MRSDPPEKRWGLVTRRHPFIWVIWLTSLVMIALFLYTGVRVLPNTATGENFGWIEVPRDGGWIVVRVDPAGPAAGRLQNGDRMISINGDPSVGRVGTFFYRRDLQSGETFQIGIARRDGEHQYPLVVGATVRLLFNRLAWFVESLVWFSVAVFIGFARPEQPLVRRAFVGAAVTSFFFLESRIFPAELDLVVISPLHVVLGYHFFYRFPDGVPSGKIWSLLLRVLYGVGALTAVLLQVLFWISFTQSGGAASQLAAAHYAVFGAARFWGSVAYNTAVVAMVAVIARNYRRVTDADQRRRIRWVVYGSAVGLTPLLWLSAVSLSQLFGAPRLPTFTGLVSDLSTVTVPISIAYVVLKHRLFDIRVVLRRGIQYLFAKRALQILLALPAVALVYTVVTNRNQTIVELVTERTGYIYWIAAAAVSLKFRGSLRLWLDRKFFREQYDREQVLVGLLDDLGKLDSVSEVSQLVSTRLEFALHPKAIYIWYRDAGEMTLAYASLPLPSGISFPSGGRLQSLIEQNGRAIGLPLPPGVDAPEEANRWLAELGVQLIAPMISRNDRLVGVLMLGEKMSEEPYSATDRGLLQAIAKQMAVVRENLELTARVGEEQRIRHEVLAHLDPRLLNLLKECPSCGACFDSALDHCERDGQRLTLTLPVERVIDRRYRIDQLIGKGGMGAVYEARDLRLERTVAIKIMTGRAFGEQQALRRFQREARAVAQLNHPQIVSVYDYGLVETKGAYLVMERIHGSTLRAEIQRLGVLPPSTTANLFEQLLDGVAAAHARGIVHRDLKPENVLIQRQKADDLTVKILDFGLAKFQPIESAFSGTALTETGAIVGTLGYMAPEQLSGDVVDHRTDIFALGVMLVEVLTGRRPFRGDSYSELMRSVLIDTYHLPGSVPEVQSLDTLLQRCLAKRLEDRIGSVAEIQRDLIPALRVCPPFRPAASAVSAETQTTPHSDRFSPHDSG